MLSALYNNNAVCSVGCVVYHLYKVSNIQ